MAHIDIGAINQGDIVDELTRLLEVLTAQRRLLAACYLSMALDTLDTVPASGAARPIPLQLSPSPQVTAARQHWPGATAQKPDHSG